MGLMYCLLLLYLSWGPETCIPLSPRVHVCTCMCLARSEAASEGLLMCVQLCPLSVLLLKTLGVLLEEKKKLLSDVWTFCDE